MKNKLLKLLKEYLVSLGVAAACIAAVGVFCFGYIVLSVALHIPPSLLIMAIFIIPALCVAVRRLWKRIKNQRED